MNYMKIMKLLVKKKSANVKLPKQLVVCVWTRKFTWVIKFSAIGKEERHERLKYMTASQGEGPCWVCFSCHSLVPVWQVNTVMFHNTLYIFQCASYPKVFSSSNHQYPFFYLLSFFYAWKWIAGSLGLSANLFDFSGKEDFVLWPASTVW